MLALATLACKTVMGTPPFGESLTLEEAKPTLQPTLSAQFDTPRLSGEDLPVLQFDPPIEERSEAGRPDLSGEMWALDSEHFRVHYTYDGEDGVPDEDENANEQPDYVEEVARALEYSWTTQIDYFGWAPPPPDAGLGDDDRYDVYLQNIMDDDYAGYTDSDDGDSIIGDNPNSPNIRETGSTHSHIVLDNDYVEYEDFADPSISLLEYMRSTAGHEFNHALQFGYDGREPHDWLWEATATWMEEESFDSINEVTETLTSVFKSPDSCQLEEGGEDRVEDSDHWYGMWILMRYLSEHYGHGAVLRLWELAAQEDGYDAWDRLLTEMQLNMEDLFRDYSIALLTRDFQEGLGYPVVRLEGEAQLGEVFDPTDGVEQLGADYVEIRGGGVFTILLESEGLTGVLVGIADNHSYVYPLVENSATIDGADLERSYLIVMNLDRATRASNCQASDYIIRVDEGDSPQQPAWLLPAPNFQAPRMEALEGLDHLDE